MFSLMLAVILAALLHITKRIWLKEMYSTTSKENSPAQVLLIIYPAQQRRDFNLLVTLLRR